MKDKIDSIVTYIDKKLLPSLSEKDISIIEKLRFIKLILKEAKRENGMINIAKIHEALHFIETIKIKYNSLFFGKSEDEMANILKKNGEIILPGHERKLRPISLSQNQFNAVPPHSHKCFGRIHTTLIGIVSDILQFKKNANILKNIKEPLPVWTYDYPLDNGEIMNEAIGEWQKKLTEKYEYQPCDDYQRGISIRGMTGRTSEDVEDLLSYLVKPADYREAEKNKIMLWLAKIGQSINRFADLLLGSGAYTSDSAALNKSCGVEQNWTLEKGKIVFHYELMVFALHMGINTWINNPSGKLIAIDPEILQTSSSLPPLMRLSAKIELAVSEKEEVFPRIKALKVTSFSQDLQGPESSPLSLLNPAQAC